MELLIFWGIPVICALIGFQRMFYRMFTKFICFTFAVYLGMWSEKLVSPIFGFLPSGAESMQPVVAIYAVAIVVWVVLLIVFNSLNPQNNHYAFPPAVDRAGGALFGFLTGVAVVSFLGIAACLTPLKTELPFGLRTESVEAASVRGVMAVTRGVNFFSGQSGRNTACGNGSGSCSPPPTRRLWS